MGIFQIPVYKFIDFIEVFRQIIRDDVPEIFLKLLQIGNVEKLVS